MISKFLNKTRQYFLKIFQKAWDKETLELTRREQSILAKILWEIDIIPFSYFVRKKIKKAKNSDKFKFYCKIYAGGQWDDEKE